MSFLFALLCAMVMFANISSSENRNSCNSSLNSNNVITLKKQIKVCLKNLEKCIENGIEFNLNEVDATTPSQRVATEFYRNEDFRFYSILNSMSWKMAEETCKNLTGNLIAFGVRNTTILREINIEMKKRGIRRVWIGLKYYENDKLLNWSDDKDLRETFLTWKNEEPKSSKTCAYLEYDMNQYTNLLGMEICDEHLEKAFCEIPIERCTL